MIVAIAAGGTGGSLFQLNPLEPGQTMTGAMTALAIGSDRVRGAELTFESLFFVGLLLFVITLGLNLVSRRLRPTRAEAVLMATDSAAIADPRAPSRRACVGGRRTSRARPAGRCSSCRSSSRSAFLLVLLADIIIKAIPAFSERGRGHPDLHPVGTAGQRGHGPGHHRLAAADGLRRRPRAAARDRRRRLPRGVRARHAG